MGSRAAARPATLSRKPTSLSSPSSEGSRRRTSPTLCLNQSRAPRVVIRSSVLYTHGHVGELHLLQQITNAESSTRRELKRRFVSHGCCIEGHGRADSKLDPRGTQRTSRENTCVLTLACPTVDLPLHRPHTLSSLDPEGELTPRASRGNVSGAGSDLRRSLAPADSPCSATPPPREGAHEGRHANDARKDGQPETK